MCWMFFLHLPFIWKAMAYLVVQWYNMLTINHVCTMAYLAANLFKSRGGWLQQPA
ncbi:hypothetical protein HanPSC8_Chr16g0694551 [Helianthus annuus]|nr:hypothetical protein HanPSC8_Chr16g0694551 [Helianthus annuus]